MRYLGLPVSDAPLRVADWGFLPDKVGHRVDPWQGLFMSSAGRLELTNSCLSSLPLFKMGIYLLHDTTHSAMDKHRCRFFWEGVGDKQKYHMVDWASVCKPKAFGGLGILNTRLMNIALMLKWIWKIYQGDTGLWADLINAKYLQGAKHKVNNGLRTYFWLDWWTGSGPLLARFPRIFSCCDQPFVTVHAARTMEGTPGEWRLRFRRQFSLAERVEWDNLCREVQALQVLDLPDEVSWSLEPSGTFSTKSVYFGLTQGETVTHFKECWRVLVRPRDRALLDEVLREHGEATGGHAVSWGWPEPCWRRGAAAAGTGERGRGGTWQEGEGGGHQRDEELTADLEEVTAGPEVVRIAGDEPVTGGRSSGRRGRFAVLGPSRLARFSEEGHHDMAKRLACSGELGRAPIDGDGCRPSG
ncbi:hypothetical protein QYE76_031256 [Lolium multiflorum]|uniref:Reverse transcriptase zinc-binding domain-containing protein n=1 Tax=Lolium multiflorum TaxID=4521 RepID=A0AAD8QRB3_LOLMU|nr:hypothetical protein QYE76_031256 [Lolium multiflorum]